MTYSFTCEVCGKTVSCKTNPENWKQKICFDCRDKQKAQGTPIAKYTPPTQARSFDLMTYISEMVVVYKALKSVCEEEKIEVPEANLAQWTTSIMIVKDRS